MYNLKKAKKGDFYTLAGQEYIGDYYVDDATNIAYSYSIYTKENQVLVPKSIHDTEKIRSLIGIESGGKEVPIPYTPKPQVFDYKRGYIKRHFAQKRNSPKSTIIEININQLSKLPVELYRTMTINWIIGDNSTNIIDINKRSVEERERDFPGITHFLKDLSKFT